MTRALATALAAAALAAALAAPAAASARAVPRGFLGVNLDLPLVEAQGSVAGEAARMAAAGVESVRLPVYWYRLQPWASRQDAPAARRAGLVAVDGVPTDFAWLDQVVEALDRRGLSLLPTVLGAPRWARAEAVGSGLLVPRDPARYASLLRGLIARYGPRGTFWRSHPRLPRRPIRTWQIWNEPDNPFYWPAPFAASYTRLLRASYAAVHTADPGARVLLASLTNRSWDALEELYAAGARGAFDQVALNPFTRDPRDVLRVIDLGRRVMASHGDGRMPVTVTEFSWPSSAGRLRVPFFAEVTRLGQAARVRQVVPLLARARRSRRLTAVYWYTWASSDLGSNYTFRYAGLRRVLRGRTGDKPALAAFRAAALGLEGCATKTVADRCAAPARRRR